MNTGLQAWPARIALMLALCSSGLLLIVFHFGWLPWPRPQYCRAVLCEPRHWQALMIGAGFVVLGLHLLVPVRYPRVIGLMVLTAIAVLLGGVIGLLTLES